MPAPIQVAEITAHKRLQGVEFLMKSALLERLFSTIAGGRTTPVTTAAPRRNTQERISEELSRARGDHDEQPLSGTYTGATHRYAMELIENGIPRQLVGFGSGRFDLWGSPELLHGRGPRLNLSLLTAVGMSQPEGVSVLIPTVCSDKLLTEYAEGLKSAIRQLYVDYIGDRTHTIVITSEHVIS